MAKVKIDMSPPPDYIKKFEMQYDFGYPNYCYEKLKKINFFIMEDRFIIKAREDTQGSEYPFDPIEIPFSSVSDVEYVEYHATSTRFFHGIEMKIMINGVECIIGLKTASIVIEKTLRQCQEFISYLRTNNYYAKFKKQDQKATSKDDIFTAIEKLGYLYRQGVLTFDEFQSKKEELLKRI